MRASSNWEIESGFTAAPSTTPAMDSTVEAKHGSNSSPARTGHSNRYTTNVTNTPIMTASEKFMVGYKLMLGPLNCSNEKSNTITICSAGTLTRGAPCMTYPMTKRTIMNINRKPGIVVMRGTIKITAQTESAKPMTTPAARKPPISSVPPNVACTTNMTVSTQPIPWSQFGAMQKMAQIMMALAHLVACFNAGMLGLSTDRRKILGKHCLILRNVSVAKSG